MKFLDKKTPQVEFDNIHVFITSGMSTNKEELVKVNWYDAIAVNDEVEKYFYIVCFASVPYTLQEYFELYGNQLASDDVVCN